MKQTYSCTSNEVTQCCWQERTCYEERVLYRLLSGMHAATNTHIARHYHAPSKRFNRTEWEPNLQVNSTLLPPGPRLFVSPPTADPPWEPNLQGSLCPSPPP